MVKHKRKLKHDIALAQDILQKLSTSPIASVLLKYYDDFAQQLLGQLQQLDTCYQGNDITVIITLVESFQENCKKTVKPLPPDEKNIFTDFFTAQLAELKKTQANIHNYQVKLNCAIDGYTLNRTTYFIDTLQAFIQKWHFNPTSPQSYLAHNKANNDQKSKKAITMIYSYKRHYKVIEKELHIAMQLKSVCEEIRAQIGSAETMPRGLVINYMTNLCTALATCKKLQEVTELVNSKLINFIEAEINQVRQLYPELAQAGEDLYKAIENSNLSKP